MVGALTKVPPWHLCLPLEGIKEYLAPLLDLNEMATDEALVSHLLLESS